MDTRQLETSFWFKMLYMYAKIDQSTRRTNKIPSFKYGLLTDAPRYKTTS